jgi:hypothetical protein
MPNLAPSKKQEKTPLGEEFKKMLCNNIVWVLCYVA